MLSKSDNSEIINHDSPEGTFEKVFMISFF